MSQPGEQRPGNLPGGPAGTGRWAGSSPRRTAPRSRTLASGVLLACLIALGTAAAWAALRGILELGPTALAAAAIGGWGIGVVLRQARAPVALAALMGLVAWALGLLLSWLLAMALLPGSSRTLPERIAATPFLDWLTPQLGLLEIVGLLLLVGVATWTARPAARPSV